MSLEEALEPLALDTAFWLGSVDDPATPIDQLGDLCLELEAKLRSLGIILLLSRADSDAFLHNLVRAAKVWETYLGRCHREARTADHNCCAGIFAPLLDALACRDQALVERLLTLTPVEFRPGHEYLEDHCYARALAELLGGRSSKDPIAALLDRCAETGNAMAAARADVVRAIMSQNADAFEEAFGHLLQLRTNEIAADKERGQLEDPVVLAQRKVFVEGVALLNLAEQFAITTQADYLMCPSIARAAMVRPFAG